MSLTDLSRQTTAFGSLFFPAQISAATTAAPARNVLRQPPVSRLGTPRWGWARRASGDRQAPLDNSEKEAAKQPRPILRLWGNTVDLGTCLPTVTRHSDSGNPASSNEDGRHWVLKEPTQCRKAFQAIRKLVKTSELPRKKRSPAMICAELNRACPVEGNFLYGRARHLTRRP